MDRTETERRAEIERIVRGVLARLEAAPAEGSDIPVEVSARHVHLTAGDARALFGEDALTKHKDISQPGQYLCAHRVRVLGPRGVLENVAVLGPVRDASQLELSRTDARLLGIDAPLRLSGDLAGAALVHVQAGEAVIPLRGAIVARRHLHLTPGDAGRMGVRDGDSVSVRVRGERPLTLEAVAVRVSEKAWTALHIDTDEANAAGAGAGTACRIAGKCCEATNDVTAPEKSPEIPSGTRFEGRLLTEMDALALSRQGVRALRLRKGQLLTPSARDVLRAHGIALLREEDGC